MGVLGNETLAYVQLVEESQVGQGFHALCRTGFLWRNELAAERML